MARKLIVAIALLFVLVSWLAWSNKRRTTRSPGKQASRVQEARANAQAGFPV